MIRLSMLKLLGIINTGNIVKWLSYKYLLWSVINITAREYRVALYHVSEWGVYKVLLIQLVEMLDLDSRCCKFDSYVAHHAQLAQLVEARDLNPLKYEFDSHIVYQISCRFRGVVSRSKIKQTSRFTYWVVFSKA